MRITKLFLPCVFFLFVACEKEALLTPEDTTFISSNQSTTIERSSVFEFIIQKKSCLMGGVQFDLHISQPELYFFLWEINGRPGGHTPQIADCHCGQEASIRVMRLSDGISVTRSLSLPPCIEKMDY